MIVFTALSLLSITISIDSSALRSSLLASSPSREVMSDTFSRLLNRVLTEETQQEEAYSIVTRRRTSQNPSSSVENLSVSSPKTGRA